MAVSGSIDWTINRNQIIRQAALECHAISANVEMNATMLQDFVLKLNAIVKAWAATGIHVWTTHEATLFPQLEQVRYQLGGSAPPDHATESFVETSLSADEASGQTVLSVSSVAGISIADHIGIMVDDGTLHWSTVASVGADTITINAGLDDSAAEGNAVFAYTSKIIRPLKVVDARRYNVDSDNETPITMISRLDYQSLPNKTHAGIVNQAWYEPGRDTGFLYLWGKPADLSELVKFTWHRPIYDFDTATDNADLPQEWSLALIYKLAESQLAQFPVSDRIANRVVGLAQQYFEMAAGYDREEGSLFFQPDSCGF